MLIVATWCLLALGVAHTIYGLVRFKQPVTEALREGGIGKFQSIDSRRLSFWFILFGPMLMMAGQVAIRATYLNDLSLVAIIGVYVLIISSVGILALPKSPFWAGLLLSLAILAGACGWIE